MMDRVNPTYLLIGIVVLSMAVLVCSVILSITGHPEQIIPIDSIIMPIVAALLGLKLQAVKVQLNSRMDGVYEEMHREVVKANSELAVLKSKQV